MLDLQKIKITCLKNPHMGGREAHYQNQIQLLVEELEQAREFLLEIVGPNCEHFGETHCVTHKTRLPCAHAEARKFLGF